MESIFSNADSKKSWLQQRAPRRRPQMQVLVLKTPTTTPRDKMRTTRMSPKERCVHFLEAGSKVRLCGC